MLVPEEVETFLAVIRAGSLLKGAEAVHATQSTVSYRIASLERRTGRQLLLRSRGGRGVTLTSDGHRFLEIAERWERLAADAAELRDQGDLRLNLGAARILLRYLFAPLLARLANYGHGLTLNVHAGTGFVLEEQVATGQLDIAFTVFREEHVDLDTRLLMRAPMAVIVRDTAGLPSRDGTMHLADLDSRSEVGMDWGTEHKLWREEAGLGTPRFHADSLSLPPLLSAPNAWTFVPHFMAADIARDTGCTVCRPAPAPPAQAFYRITRKGQRATGSPEIKLVDSICRDLWPDWYFAD